MDYGLVFMTLNCERAGTPFEVREKAVEFSCQYSDSRYSNSACGHLGEGWFVIYDYPLAEEWARKCSWKALYHRCVDIAKNNKEVPNSYTLVHFSDPQGEIEMKLRWC